MEYKSSPRITRSAGTALIVIGCAALMAARLSHSAAYGVADQKKALLAEQVRGLVRAGLGRGVMLADPDPCPGEVRASVLSVQGFIYERSGLSLDRTLADRLVNMEEAVLKGERRRIKASELGALLSAVAIERIRNSSDAVIEQVADDFANIRVIRRTTRQELPVSGERSRADRKAAEMPSDEIMLRSTSQGVMSKEVFVKEAKSLRVRLQSPVVVVTLTGLMRREATDLITERVASFADALPEQWNQAQREGLTPVQSLLVVYSAVSDDRLWYSNADLRRMMKESETQLKAATGVTVSSEGRHAYGAGGYIFSSALDIALDRPTTARILDLIEQRSSK